MKDFADDNFKFNENGRKFSKRVENTVGKKEKLLVASNSSFSHSVFNRLVQQTRKKSDLVWERVNPKKVTGGAWNQTLDPCSKCYTLPTELPELGGRELTIKLLNATQGPFPDSVDEDQTAQNVLSDP